MKTFTFNIKFITLTLSLLLLSKVSAATLTWTAWNGSWHNPNNWDTGTVPTASDHVIIPAGRNCIIGNSTYNNLAFAKSVRVSSEASLYLLLGSILTIEQGRINKPRLTNFGNVYVEGTLRILDIKYSLNPTNFSHQVKGIFNQGNIQVQVNGTIITHDVEGIVLYNKGVFLNYGGLEMFDSQKGISRIAIYNANILDNYGNIDTNNHLTTFYSPKADTYSRTLNEGDFDLANGDCIVYSDFINNDEVRIRGKIKLYSDFINNGEIRGRGKINVYSGTLENYGTIDLYENNASLRVYAHLANDGIIEISGAEEAIIIEQTEIIPSFVNKGRITLTNNLIDLENLSTIQIINKESGRIDAEAEFASDLINEGFFSFISDVPYFGNILNTGVVEDRNGKINLNHFENEGILLKPVQGELIEGEKIPNIISIGSLNSILDIDFGSFGYYDINENYLLPSLSAQGLDFVRLRIETNVMDLVGLEIRIIPNTTIRDRKLSSYLELEQFHSNVKINISPNPTNGIFTIETQKFQSVNLDLELINCNGQVISRKSIQNSDSYTWNEENASPGFYFLRIRGDKNEYAQEKIIIQN